MVAPFTALAGLAVVIGLTVAVHLDAARVDVNRPRLWTAFTFATTAAGLVMLLFVPSVPLPGLLVLASLGPILYALERDDTLHGDAAGDPTRLPSQEGRDRKSGEEDRD